MNLFRSAPGSTTRLLQYSFLYFGLYTVYGLLVKYFQGPAAEGFPGITETEFLIYSSLGGSAVCLSVVFLGGWLKHRWTSSQVLFLFLSGTCTALVIPTTTLMYSLPISVMVAMVLMRGSVIVISRLVDTILLLQGVSQKKVRWEENAAMVAALLAVGSNLWFAKSGDFAFLESRAACTILTVYIVAYAFRIYLMNYFKFTGGGKSGADNRNYFGLEQVSASFWILGVALLALLAPDLFSAVPAFPAALHAAPSAWAWVVLAGVPFGAAAFFSVFLFMFQGRSSTFSGLVNRISSLLAGTSSTLLFALLFGGRWPKPADWVAFGLIFVAVAFLTRAEKK